MEETPNQEVMENIDVETRSSFEAYLERYKNMFENIEQTGEDIAEVILEAITSPNPNFRYLTNKQFSRLIEAKYVDITGDAPLEAMRRRSLPDKK